MDIVGENGKTYQMPQQGREEEGLIRNDTDTATSAVVAFGIPIILGLFILALNLFLR